jgi:homoserine dehydrogenase
MQRVPLIIFGAGNVGRALVRQVLDAASLHEQRDGIKLSIVAWCDSAGAVVDPDGLGPETLRATETAKSRGVPLADTPAGYQQGDLTAIVDVAGSDGCIIADVTAGPATVPALESALRMGYGVATANKVPLTLDQATFDRLASNRRFLYESTVGSAVPVIEALHGLLRAADRIDMIRGALSGTLGFLCTGLQAGQPFGGLVREALRRGYTEPDPRIDLGGMDVARKALILARTMGWRLEMHDVAVSSLVPAELAGLPQAEFMAHLDKLDASFAGRVAEAARDGKVLRFVGELAAGKATVGLQALAQDTALGRLRGNDNLVAFHTHYYPDEPLVVQGRGAGVDAAAAGVHSDIIALATCTRH